MGCCRHQITLLGNQYTVAIQMGQWAFINVLVGEHKPSLKFDDAAIYLLQPYKIDSSAGISVKCHRVLRKFTKTHNDDSNKVNSY